MLLMDMGSTKRDVIDAVRRVLKHDADTFVPCHPIAGREVAGVENADPMLFSGKQVIITPMERTQAAKLEQAAALWQALGCSTTQMSAEAHDAAFAAVSHLPHMLAFAMMNGIASQQEQTELFLSLF